MITIQNEQDKINCMMLLHFRTICERYKIRKPYLPLKSKFLFLPLNRFSVVLGLGLGLGVGLGLVLC